MNKTYFFFGSSKATRIKDYIIPEEEKMCNIIPQKERKVDQSYAMSAEVEERFNVGEQGVMRLYLEVLYLACIDGDKDWVRGVIPPNSKPPAITFKMCIEALPAYRSITTKELVADIINKIDIGFYGGGKVFDIFSSIEGEGGKCLKVLDVSLEDIKKSTRSREVVAKKALLCDYLYNDLGYNYTEIGRYIGKDHSSVIYSLETNKDIIKKHKAILLSKLETYNERD